MLINLRKITMADQPKLMRWRQQPDVTKYMYTDPKITLDGQCRWFTQLQEDLTREAWIIQCDGVDIGFFNFYDIDRVNCHAGWGYYIAEPGYQGKGVGKSVECSAYDHAFNVLGMNKVWAEVFDWNDKVIQIHKYLGCKIEANLPQHIFKNGEYHDLTRVCMLREWWANSQIGYIKATFYRKNGDRVCEQLCRDCVEWTIIPGNEYCRVFWDGTDFGKDELNWCKEFKSRNET